MLRATDWAASRAFSSAWSVASAALTAPSGRGPMSAWPIPARGTACALANWSPTWGHDELGDAVRGRGQCGAHSALVNNEVGDAHDGASRNELVNNDIAGQPRELGTLDARARRRDHVADPGSFHDQPSEQLCRAHYRAKGYVDQWSPRPAVGQLLEFGRTVLPGNGADRDDIGVLSDRPFLESSGHRVDVGVAIRVFRQRFPWGHVGMIQRASGDVG